MAKSEVVKIPDDIEYRVIGNAFGLLIASAGLLAGEMVRMRSFDYWLNDIAPLLFVSWMVFRLYRNFLSTMTAYHDQTPSVRLPSERQILESLRSEQAAVAQITSKTGYTPDN
jgi:ABC-type nickel/cobalt efflux system permease component RcnA